MQRHWTKQKYGNGAFYETKLNFVIILLAFCFSCSVDLECKLLDFVDDKKWAAVNALFPTNFKYYVSVNILWLF